MELEKQLNAFVAEMNLKELKQIIAKLKATDSPADTIQATKQASLLLEQREKLHEVICQAFSTRFPDLAKLVPNYEVYARIAKHLCCHDSIENTELQGLLTQQQSVLLNLGIESTLGPEINDHFFNSACDLQIEASAIAKDLSTISTKKVTKLAPNLCALVGAEQASLLISQADGV